MIIVKELNNWGNEVHFIKEMISDNAPTISNHINCKTVTREIDGFTFLMLYNSRMQPISSIFGFLNFEKASQSINSRTKAMHALKLLICFEEIIYKSLNDFTVSDINNLKLFLEGFCPSGQFIKYELISSRSNQTVNDYLSIYRQYIAYLGLDNKYLFQKSSKKALIRLPYQETNFSVDRYKSNEKIPRKIIEVPCYISVEEFALVIELIRNSYGILEEIIVRLMFQCGFRIGEVLGLTADDLVIETSSDDFIPTAYIRNRLSDRFDQHAKTCMKIIDAKQYKSKNYQTKDYGYQTVVVPTDLYDLINEYIEEIHNKARKKYKTNYYKYTIADRVRKAEKYEDDNYYIFLNSIGKPVLSHSWNVTLRNIFKKCGISVDKECRKNNLNHRFRHGFAMFNVQHLHCKEIELAERLRHSSLMSVSVYFKPTISDRVKIKTAFAESLYDTVPILRKGGL